jgi:twinkle protein
VIVDGVSQDEKFCVASMEMLPRKLGRKMYQQICGVELPAPAFAKKAMEYVAGNVWIFDAYGTQKAKKILEVFDYARRKYGITNFVIDSLAKCGLAEDDYNGQKEFVDVLMEFARKYNVHVCLVVHIRKGMNEDMMPGKMDVKGTGAITDMVDNLFIIWRNKKKEAAMASGDAIRMDKFKDKPDAILSCEKQRETGDEPTFYLSFHGKSCQYIERSDCPPKTYIR